MEFITGVEGELTKMRLTVCEDTEPFNPRTGDDFTYEVLINPEKIERKFQSVLDTTQGEGTTGTDVRFRAQLPQALKLELLFDATGVVANDKIPFSNVLGLSQAEAVSDQVARFKSIVFDYDGTKHSPNLIQVQWGDFIFKGKLKDLTVTYTLFKPDGTPLRAKATCNLVESLSDALRVARERSESPDLTHIRTVMEGENLPLMTHRIYNDPAYHIEVARINSLKSIRGLKTGSRIYFPPINKESK